jgi:hypothetical protein
LDWEDRGKERKKDGENERFISNLKLGIKEQELGLG